MTEVTQRGPHSPSACSAQELSKDGAVGLVIRLPPRGTAVLYMPAPINMDSAPSHARTSRIVVEVRQHACTLCPPTVCCLACPESMHLSIVSTMCILGTQLCLILS